MARRPGAKRLVLWMNGIRVGTWDNSTAGERLVYHDDWVADPQGRPLSLSLPFLPGNQPHRGALVQYYFDNLLPDSEPIRRRIASRYNVGDTSPFELLAELGRDCVGALQLLAEGETPENLRTIRGEPLADADIARILRDTTVARLPGQTGQTGYIGDLRLSIAGAQEKTALLWHEGQWHLPVGATPTTHIFKLPLGLVGNMRADMGTSVENEWLCAQIIEAYGLPIARCQIGRFQDQKALVVERFDRRPSQDGSWILRLPQEDMCQATGTPASKKYQSDGGPGIDRVNEVLAGSALAIQDRLNFLATQIIFWMLAATDGHAKNFSIAHQPGNHYVATPLYDVLSAHPIIGKGRNRLAPQKATLAMAVHGKNAHYAIEGIMRRHWISQGRRIGFSADEVETLLATITARTELAIDAASALLPRDFPAEVAEAIFTGMRRQRRRLAGA